MNDSLIAGYQDDVIRTRGAPCQASLLVAFSGLCVAVDGSGRRRCLQGVPQNSKHGLYQRHDRDMSVLASPAGPADLSSLTKDPKRALLFMPAELLKMILYFGGAVRQLFPPVEERKMSFAGAWKPSPTGVGRISTATERNSTWSDQGWACGRYESGRT